MSETPAFSTAGSEQEKLDVRLSYRIVRLFSEGLYASPNKAIEELVANSFDAGARRVAVFLSPDFHPQKSATIAVLDDGEGMDAEGLKQHWLIGKSLKRDLDTLPMNRRQIGKFGIGKLATYVLANRLTHISKKGGKYFSTSMDFRVVDQRGDEEVEPKNPIKIALRTLSEDEAKKALSDWLSSADFKACSFSLFGAKAPESWTFAVLSDLKDKVHEIKRGTLKWILSTALPLRDDFAIYLDGERLAPSKAHKGRIQRWVIGKDITEIPTPAPDDIEVVEDKSVQSDSPRRYGLSQGTVGRFTGYAEIYKDLLTGKSNNIGRSHGFFVYVLDRLINVEDPNFGIPADILRHGTLGRIRVVVHMDGLDNDLQSDRERIREGPVRTAAQNILQGIFNKLRPELDKADDGESPGAKLARKLGASPANLARGPIVSLVRSAFDGKAKPRFIALPNLKTQADKDNLIWALETRAQNPEQFVTGVDVTYSAASTDGLAVYDALSGALRVNGLHPFVGAFFDEFTSKTSGLPLEVFAMAEVLLEAHLHAAGLAQDDVDRVMLVRDQLLRNAGTESGRMTPLMVANALRNSRNDQHQLEVWVVEAFRSLGFEATKLGGPSKPDGVADAPLAPDTNKQPQRYKVSLEAKSKEKEGAAVSAKSVGIATIARHRKEFDCQHAVIVGQLFPTSKEASALEKEIAADRANMIAAKDPRTITLVHIDDLANLVQHRPVKALPLQRIREWLQKCSLPAESKAWIDGILAENPVKHDFATIIKTIAKLQAGPRNEPVEYGELRAELRHGTPKLEYPDIAELREVCQRMAGLAPQELDATERTIALNQAVPNILAKLESATKAHLTGDK